MLSTSGPKKQRIFGAVEDDDDDLDAFNFAVGVPDQVKDGEYSVKGTGEKFSLGKVSASKKEKTPEEIEAEEMAAALE